MKDISAVEWLPLAAAVRRLSYPLERLFLHHVGRRMFKRRRKPTRRKAMPAQNRARGAARASRATNPRANPALNLYFALSLAKI